jgi:beta-lactamase regulating signal transducer with metallopeptidase domain
MDRELVLATLACALGGAALAIAGAIQLRLAPTADVRELERRAWYRLWLPVLPAALLLAFLTGWALQEPEDSEAANPVLVAMAAGFGLVWLRAIVRAVRALRPSDAVAMTSGLIRPRVSVAPAFAARLDERALRAVHAHEAAHARHRDPLRMWLAQLATDLQWPSRRARLRFADWRAALELARDAEACEHVDGSDLAAALIEAAQLTAGEPDIAIAGLVDGSFSDRIYRLLDAPRATRPAPHRRWAWAIAASALGLAAVAGGLCGEAIVSLLPGLG